METLSDIVAQIRAAAYIQNADTPKSVLRLADRIEAAWRREKAEAEADALAVGGIVEAARHTPGNAAAMREALENIAGYAETARCHTDDVHILSFLGEIEGWARSALSAPPRNCDAMPWREAWDEWRAKHHPQNPQTFNESYEATVSFMEWFTAPASEKGADDGE